MTTFVTKATRHRLRTHARLKCSLLALAAGTALSLSAGMATAQTVPTVDLSKKYTKLVVFGDSLSDNGNLFAATTALTGTGNPPFPYYQGRFSSGPVWSERLGFSLGNFPLTTLLGIPTPTPTGSVDYAFGGALTNAAQVNLESGLPNNPLSTESQINAYLAGGGSFKSTDLVTYWAGANNLLQGFKSLPPGVSAAQAQATMTGIAAAAANDAGKQVGLLNTAGAGTVLVANMPNLGMTPAFAVTSANPAIAAAQASAQQLAGLTSATFNGALQAQLIGLSATSKSNLILFDVNKVFSFMKTNGAAFGLTDVNSKCFNAAAASVCSSPATTLFWDDVHPTGTVHGYLAAAAYDYLTYSDQAANYGQLALASYDARLTATDRIAERARAQGQDGTTVWVDASSQNSDHDATAGSAKGKTTQGGVALGVDHGFGKVRLGLAARAAYGDIKSGAIKADMETYSFDIYGRYALPHDVYLAGSLGIGHNEFSAGKRQTVLAQVSQDFKTSADHWSVRGEVGRPYHLTPQITVAPYAAIGYGRVEMDGLTEDGALANLKLSSSHYGGTTGELGARLTGQWSDQVSAHLDVAYRDWLSTDQSAANVSIADNSAKAIALAKPADPKGEAIISAGIEAKVTKTLRLGISYQGRTGGSTTQSTARLGGSLSF